MHTQNCKLLISNAGVSKLKNKLKIVKKQRTYLII